MRIPVEGIPAAGRQVDFTLRDDWAAQAAQRSLERDTEQLQGSLSLSFAAKRRGIVRVDGTVKALAPADCDRCGEPCGLHVDESFSLLYAPEEVGGEAFDGGEIELQVDELDLGWYRNGEINLADVLHEALALSLPALIACADRGECDKRTGELLAHTKASAGHPAFEVLSGLRSRSDDAG